jgi:hypothetical protein
MPSGRAAIFFAGSRFKCRPEGRHFFGGADCTGDKLSAKSCRYRVVLQVQSIKNNTNSAYPVKTIKVFRKLQFPKNFRLKTCFCSLTAKNINNLTYINLNITSKLIFCISKKS